MEEIRTQLTALLFMLVFVLGVTVFERADTIAQFLERDDAVAAVVNPVSDFLGVSEKRDTSKSAAAAAAQPTPEEKTTLWDRIRSIVNTPTAPAADETTTRLSERTPLLLCVPSAIHSDETALVFWACRDGADRTRAQGFSTDGAVVGATRITLEEGQTLSLDCITDRDGDTFTTTVASCAVQVVVPTISLVANPDTVAPGESARIAWETTGIRACTLRSDTDPSFVRSGIVGDVVYRARSDSELTLTCEDATGLTVTDSITVKVR